MRITSAIRRREEFAADALAVQRAGREVHVEALRRIHAYAPAFDAYWANEVAAVLSAGRRPPVVAGFGTFLRSAPVTKAADEFLDRSLEERTGPYDSHPSLSERIAAVRAGRPTRRTTPPAAMALDPRPGGAREGDARRAVRARGRRAAGPRLG